VSCGSSSQTTVNSDKAVDSLTVSHTFTAKTDEKLHYTAHYRVNQWLFAVSDSSLMVFDARDGNYVKTIGKISKPGPIKVNGGLLFLLDIGQEIIQSIILPTFETSGILGAGGLKKPVDMTIFASDVNKTSYFVSHSGDSSFQNSKKILSGSSYFALNETSEDIQNPPIGELTGSGILYKPGAIEVDPTMGTIAVVEKSEFPNKINFFDLNGNYDPTYRTTFLVSGEIPDIELYYCTEGKGYWLIAQNTEFGGKRASLNLIDRVTNEYYGEIWFEDVNEIRSMCIVQSKVGVNIGGMLYIVNEKGKLYGYPWESIKEKLNLKHFCEINR